MGAGTTEEQLDVLLARAVALTAAVDPERLLPVLPPGPVADAGAGHGGVLLRVTVTDRTPETVVLQTLIGRLGLAVEIAGGSVETVAGGRYGRLLLRVTGDVAGLDAAVGRLRDDGILVEQVPAGAGVTVGAGVDR